MAKLWRLNPKYKDTQVAKRFETLTEAAEVQGDLVTHSPLSRLHKAAISGKNYYVKTYHRSGKKLRKYVGRSRIRAEWENLRFFLQLGIAIPTTVAFGEVRSWFHFKLGALITEELPDTYDLETIADNNKEKFSDTIWLRQVMDKLVFYTGLLHKNRFIHGDLKWRNILVDFKKDPNVYFIDCPQGKKKFSWFKRRGIIKDLACLDKKAKYVVSRTWRLRFYLAYQNCKCLQPAHKKQLRKILKFHQGRE